MKSIVNCYVGTNWLNGDENDVRQSGLTTSVIINNMHKKAVKIQKLKQRKQNINQDYHKVEQIVA